MAKYDVTYSCGHTGIVELFGKNSERERKLKWYEEGVCPECYKTQKRVEQEKQPLVLNIDLDPFDRNGFPFILFFSGNSYSVKEEIKNLGYSWGDLVTGVFEILQKPQKAWQMRVSAEELDDRVNAVKDFFPDVVIKRNFSKLDVVAYAENKKQANEKTEKLNKELSELTPPQKPACYPTGKWNGRVYGSKKNGYNIYVDGDKQEITVDEKELLENYQRNKEDYNKQVAKIKAKYN